MQDRELIMPSTKMSWNDFENGSSESERTLQAIGCCTTMSRQLKELSIREFLAKKNVPTLPHPFYSPDPAPCDLYLFPKLKSKLKGHHFGTMIDELRTLTENDFRYCCDQWKER
jgi:hypothetical protein